MLVDSMLKISSIFITDILKIRNMRIKVETHGVRLYNIKQIPYLSRTQQMQVGCPMNILHASGNRNAWNSGGICWSKNLKFSPALRRVLLDRPLWRFALWRSALIANTTDRESDALGVAEPAHVGEVVAEVATVREAATVLRSTPKVGGDAEIEVVAEVVAASGKGRETCGIVGGGIITQRIRFA